MHGLQKALGESYASGPTTGEEHNKTNSECRQYTKAFGPQIAEDGRILGPKPTRFSFIACSGAKFENIYADASDNSGGGGGKPKDSQAKQLKDTNPDMVTLSISSNDVRFVKLLDKVSDAVIVSSSIVLIDYKCVYCRPRTKDESQDH